MLYIEGITKLYKLKGFFTQPEKAGDTLLDISSETFIAFKIHFQPPQRGEIQ